MRAFYNFFSLCITYILIVVLVFLLLILPIASIATDMLDPETLGAFMDEHDFSGILQAINNDFYGADSHSNELKMLGSFLETETAKKVLSLYVKDLGQSAQPGSEYVPQLTQQALQSVIMENPEDLLPLVQQEVSQIFGEGAAVPDAFLGMFLQGASERISSAMMRVLPSAADLGLSNLKEITGLEDITPAHFIGWLCSGELVELILIAIGILALLIIVLRFPRFGGFAWLAFGFLVCSGIYFGLIFVLKDPSFVLNYVPIPETLGAVSGIFAQVSGSFRQYAILTAICAGFCIVIKVIGCLIFKRK